MSSQKYSVNQPLIETLVTWVKSGEIAIPEIQRPFVWSSTKVRDLMDSLYQGYPIGYIIAWRNPNIKLKDGSLSEGKKILIDGQQRVTALNATIIGQQVVNKDYKKIRIKIAFNPIEEKFETLTPAIEKDKKWVDDISTVFNGDLFDIVGDYLEQNPDTDKKKIQTVFQDLINIPKKQIGLIELSGDLDIEKVTEIFIRINSQGVELSQADFVMSKIAANEIYGGNLLRKAIDYFSHLAVAPEFYTHIDILKKKGLTRGQYNQVANYVYTQSEINIKIGNKPIEKYLKEVKDQCNDGGLIYGGITELNLLYNNLKQNAVPYTILEMTIEDYQEFLQQRRVKIAEKMREYYEKI